MIGKRGVLCRTALLGSAFVAASLACGLDSDAPGPQIEPAAPVPSCTTDAVFPKLLGFARSQRVSPLASFVERRLLPSEGQPAPDPSLRSLLGALVQIVSALGLDRLIDAADVAERTKLLEKVRPLVIPALQFITGDVDGREHYEGLESVGTFAKVCPSDPLFDAVRAVLRFESPSEPGRLWLDVLMDAVADVLKDPTLVSALNAFEANAERGRPAAISLVAQIMTFLDDDTFDIERVRVLYSDVVVPAVDPALASRIERLIDLLAEATEPSTGIFSSVQGAFRCGNLHPEDRDQLVGALFDLVVSDALDLDGVFQTTTELVSSTEARELFGTIADVVEALQADARSQEQITQLVAVALEPNEVRLLLPTMIDVLESGVLEEIAASIPILLSDCEAGS